MEAMETLFKDNVLVEVQFLIFKQKSVIRKISLRGGNLTVGFTKWELVRKTYIVCFYPGETIAVQRTIKICR